MTEETDVLAKHAERRRAFLARTASTSPVVGLLLAQSARPARAATYGGGGGTTTVFGTPSLSETTDFTFTLPETTTNFPITTVVTIPISTSFAPTTVFTIPFTTFAPTTVFTVPFTTSAPTTVFTVPFTTFAPTTVFTVPFR